MNRESLISTLDNASANQTDIYYRLYEDYFENGDEPEEALQIIIEYARKIGDAEDNNPQKINRQEENRISSMYGGIIYGIVDRITEMNPTKENFYKKLYEALFKSDNELLPQSKDEKVIALKILSESVLAIPYYQIIETERISKEEFIEGVNNLQSSLREANYMLNRQFSTTPEEGAQIVRIADSIKDKRQQIIFWTVVINNLRDSNEKEST